MSGHGTEWKRRKLLSTVWSPLGLSSCRDTGTNKVDEVSSCQRDLKTPVEAVGIREGEQGRFVWGLVDTLVCGHSLGSNGDWGIF